MNSAELVDLFVPGQRFVHLIGGGGKTSLMFALARAMVDTGRRVITTTTTRIFRPTAGESVAVLVGTTGTSVVTEALDRHGHVTLALREDPGSDGPGKLVGHSRQYLSELHMAGIADAILIEADGSAGRPLKAHADHEPVVCDSADGVIVVVGCDAIGAPLSGATVHRPEIVAARFGVQPGARLDAGLVSRVILEDHIPRLPARAAVTVFISRVTTTEGRHDATRLATRLSADDRVGRIVIGDIRSGRLEAFGGT